MQVGKKREKSEQSEIVEDTGEQHKEVDPTEEMLEWAKGRMAVLSESTPGVMGPVDGFRLDSEPNLCASKSTPSGSKAVGATKPREELMILVVTLDADAAREGRAHLFNDGEEASRFIETLVADGLDTGRVMVFQGTPMKLNVSYRPVAAIE